ncbi:L-serine ammonia-lyase, iron-sulfur-dependent, subunit alpha [Vibrio lentus]|nr:L-serine ammonia-lyase, iron-sulfur-dependent, subunit alpha [Vibrio lentus]
MKNQAAFHSDEESRTYFANIWRTMRECMDRGMNTEGILPGPLRVPRRAAALRQQLITSRKTTNDPMTVVDWVRNMFAFAVNEENAAGDRVVTAPTNGACGIISCIGLLR